MKLYFSPASPFVRKTLICAIELGLNDKIERLPSAPHPVNRDRSIVAANPLGKVPTLTTDDGTVLYDSRVICEYLDAVDGQHRLFPQAGPARWRALVEQSLSDGLLDAAILGRYEILVRPEASRSNEWLDGQMDKITCALAKFEEWLPSFGDRLDIGTISVACALGYLDFRYPHLAWREGRAPLAAWFERFSRRPSFIQTAPPA